MVDVCCGQPAGLYLLISLVLMQDSFLVNGVGYITSFLCAKCVIILYYAMSYYVMLCQVR